MDLLTFPKLFRVIRDEVLSRNGKLSRDAAERDGTDLNIMLACATVGAEEVGAQLTELEARMLIESAEDDELDILIVDRTGGLLIRKDATAALGSVEFRTTAPAASAFTIPANLELTTEDGIRFLTSEPSLFAKGSIGPVVVGVRSVLAGLDQATKSGTVTAIKGSIVGQPSDLTVTNTLATVGAGNRESNESYRDRYRRFWTTARKGTLRAVETGALDVDGVVKAKAFEVVDVSGRPARFVQLIVSDQFTATLVDLAAVPATYARQSQQLVTAVNAGLTDVRAGGIYVQVIVGQVVLQAVTLNLRFLAGVDVNVVAQLACATIVAFINSLAPGETLTLAGMRGALRAVPGLDPTSDVASPAGDVLPKPLQVLRTESRLVTPLSVRSDQPLVSTGNPDSYLLVA